MDEEAYLWTDGRYFLQASQELSSDWTLMRSGEPNVLELNDWIAMNMKSGSVVGVDPFLMSTSQAKGLEKQLQSKGITLKAVDTNPVDAVWATSRPAVPNSPIAVHPMEFAGVHHSEKIAKVQKELEKNGSIAFVVSMLDEVCF
jgi:Xaa-Pro aminopeptidase